MLNIVVKTIVWILNLLFYIVIINLALLPGALAGRSFLGTFGCMAVILMVNLFFVLYLGGKLYNLLFEKPTELEEAETIFVGRFYSGRKYFLIGMALNLVVFGLLWLLVGDFAGSTFVLILMSILPLGGLAWGIYKPRERAPKSLSLFINIGIVCAFVLQIISLFIFYLSPREINYSSNEYAPWRYYALERAFIKKMLPPEATAITITGNLISPYWQCSVRERDFLNFAAINNYKLKENDPYYNANSETNSESVNSLSIFPYMKEPPVSYYIYNYRYRNHGGWLLLYDRDKQILHGSYSRY